VKNGDPTQFTKNNQPSSEAKSAGWKKQQLLDTLLHYQEVTLEEFETLQKDLETNKNKYTITDLMAFKYASKLISSDKFLLDWIDMDPEYDSKKEEDFFIWWRRRELNPCPKALFSIMYKHS
jgi:hypothetical protein